MAASEGRVDFVDGEWSIVLENGAREQGSADIE